MPVSHRPAHHRRGALATVLGAAVATVLGAVTAPPAGAAAAVVPFPTLQAPLTQELVATFSVPAGGYAGGLVFTPDGTLVVGVCRGAGQLHRLGGTPVQRHGSTVLPDLPVDTSEDVGCGLVNGPDGIYANSGTGVVKVDAVTGAVLARSSGPAGNGLGIAYDAHGGRFVYAGPTGLAWASTDLSRSGVFTTRSAYDGVYLDPTGDFVFAADGEAVDILDRDGTLVQRVEHTAGPGGPTDGVAFHGRDGYVVTNNTDGTITRLDFPDRDLTRPPTHTLLASGGFRGDLVQVGPDSCLYVTQDGARYADGTVTTEQSIVKICGGFVPPPETPSLRPVALGDGFTSGEGTGSYLPGSDALTPHNSCHRSTAAYPGGLATARHLAGPVTVACSHARIADLHAPNTSGQLTGSGTPEPAQLDALGRDTQLVTLTIGAEDLGLDRLLATCLRGDLPAVKAGRATPVLAAHRSKPPRHQPAKPGGKPGGKPAKPGNHDGGKPGSTPGGVVTNCSSSPALAAEVDAALAALAGGPSGDPATAARAVPALLAEITDRAPQAEILLAGYPIPFGTDCPAQGCRAGLLTPVGGGGQVDALIDGVDTQWINRTVARLNDVLRTAAAGAPRTTYTDVTSTFAGHGRCDRSQPWLNPVAGTVGPDGKVVTLEPQSLHPTSIGQAQGYLAALSAGGGSTARWLPERVG